MIKINRLIGSSISDSLFIPLALVLPNFIAFIFAKFKYFAKQIIYLESLAHVLQNDI